MSDSWKIDGNCKNCRRKNYCHKPCTLNKQIKEFAIRTAISHAVNKVTDPEANLGRKERQND